MTRFTLYLICMLGLGSIRLSAQEATETSLPCEIVYQIVDSMPQYPGGYPALSKDIRQLSEEHFTEEELNKWQFWQGSRIRIFCSVIIDKDGATREPTIRRSGGFPALDKIALSVMLKLKRFTPARQGGKAVCVEMVIPVLF